MWKSPLFIVILVAGPLFGQLDPHTLTISATRSTYLQPDDAVFNLYVISSASTTVDQVVASLAALGVNSSNLTGVNNTSSPPNLQWNFNLAVPLSSLTATIGSLTKLEQTITQNNSGLTLTFTVGGTQVSPHLQQSQSCSNSDLIADATAQAQQLAAAAGLTLGPILKLSNGSLAQPGLLYANFALQGYIVVNDFVPGASPVSCSLVVEFQLRP